MAAVVREELRREPRTLFLVGSYQIGKERAVAAVARAAKSRAGVGWHRARTLKLSGWWDDELFLCEDDEYAVAAATEAANAPTVAPALPPGPGVAIVGSSTTDATAMTAANQARVRPPCCVRVVSMGGGGQHDAMLRILQDEVDPVTGQQRWGAVVAFRPTGWSYTRSRWDRTAGRGQSSAAMSMTASQGGAGVTPPGTSPPKSSIPPSGADRGAGGGGGVMRSEALVKTEEVPPEPRGEVNDVTDADGFVRVVKTESNVDDEVREGEIIMEADTTRATALASLPGSSSSTGVAAVTAAGYKPWVENGGATRCYSVPYSEHSSFTELVAFVERVRPNKVTPTVNADTPKDRERILKHFLPFTNLAADKGRLDHYFKRPQKSVAAANHGEFAADHGEARLLASYNARDKGKSVITIDDDDDNTGGCGAGTSCGVAEGRGEGGGRGGCDGIDPEILAALGGVLTPAELRQQTALWEEAQRSQRAAQTAAQEAVLGPFPLGCVALVKGGGGGFGGNGPRYVQFRDKQHVEQRLRALGATIVQRNSPRVTHVVVPAGGEALTEEQRRHGVHDGAKKGEEMNGSGARSSGGGKDQFKFGADVTADDDLDQDGDIAAKGGGPAVSGKEMLLKTSKGGSKTGTGPVVVTEGWVMRHVRASRTGVAAAHDPAAIRAHKDRLASERKKEAAERMAAVKRRREEADAGVEQRPGRERTMSRAVMDRVGRALAQRLFLVQRRDISRGHGADGGGGGGSGGEGKWHAVFAVFGTTGNVYECNVCATPSCTCPDFTGEGRDGPTGKHICKHLLWLYLKVLGVSRDNPVLCQVALLQSELAAMLEKPTAAQRASLAAATVREAYVEATGGVRGTEETAPAPVRRQPTSNADTTDDDVDEVTCPVCFDPIEDPADKAAGLGMFATADEKVWWCQLGCGGNVHAACMRRWIGKSGQSPACPLCRAAWNPQERGGGGEGAPLPAAADVVPLALPSPGTSSPGGGGAGGYDYSMSPGGGTPYVNLRRYQPGTAAGRDLGQYNEFAQRAIERREDNERRRRSSGGA